MVQDGTVFRCSRSLLVRYMFEWSKQAREGEGEDVYE